MVMMMVMKIKEKTTKKNTMRKYYLAAEANRNDKDNNSRSNSRQGTNQTISAKKKTNQLCVWCFEQRYCNVYTLSSSSSYTSTPYVFFLFHFKSSSSYNHHHHYSTIFPLVNEEKLFI